MLPNGFCNLLCTAICLLPSFVRVAWILFLPFCFRATLTGTDVRYIESIKPLASLRSPCLLYLPQQFVRNDHLCGLARRAARRHIDRPIMRIWFHGPPPGLVRMERRRGENEEVKGRGGDERRIEEGFNGVCVKPWSPGSVWTQRQQK